MRVMFDNNVFSHSQFANAVMRPQGPAFGKRDQHVLVLGFERKPLHRDAEYQAQMDALYTVGRLIREKKIEAYSYGELLVESMNDWLGESVYDALYRCAVAYCDPPIERSRFLQGDYSVYARKGGKKDKKNGIDTSLSQITFMEWLCSFDSDMRTKLISIAPQLRMTEFEVESVWRLERFQQMCRISGSPENYPDMYHLWATERNHLDVFLTLERKLPLIAKRIDAEAKDREYPTKVMRPLELLAEFGISVPDLVPIEPDGYISAFDLMMGKGGSNTAKE
jgi:hypothetical protein